MFNAIKLQLMDSRRGKTRMNVQCDRLSSLSDDLLHKILAFIDIKQAIETSAVSSRWRYVWTSMPCLDFSSEDFHSLPEYSKFVAHVLDARNNQTEVHSVNLTFNGEVNEVFSERILNYAFSHNVQQLNITNLPEKNGFSTIESHLSVFSSQSLKNLTLSGCIGEQFIRAPPTWYLPALTTLDLHCVIFHDDNTTDKCAGLFSNCANLKNLTIDECIMPGLNGLSICHYGLSNLTLINGCDEFNVVTPQLKNLTIINWSGVHLVSAPDLASLHYTEDDNDIDCVPLKVSTELLHLEKVDVRIQCFYEGKEHTHRVVCLLQQLHSVKFLTLNLELVKLLSSSLELISHQPSPFTCLKSLNIYPADVTKPEEVTMSIEVKNYLLDGSQGATFTLVSYEEIRAEKNVTSASKLMTELQVLLDQWKESSEEYTTDMKQEKASMENHLATEHEQVEVENQLDTEMKAHFGADTKRYWDDLNKQLEKGYKNTGRVISMLREIEAVLTKLPTSYRAKLQASFFSLYAKAETVMNNAMDRMKIHCDKRPRRSNV